MHARGLRAAVIAGAGVALTAWLVAGASTRPASRIETTPGPAGSGAASSTAAVVTRTERLRARLAEMPPQRARSRNPFRFGETTAPRAAGPAVTRRAETPSEHAAEQVPARPVVQLLGIAQDGEDAGAARTAILSAQNQLYLVTEGQQVALRFQVRRISAEAVELQDLLDDSTLTLTLR